MVLVDRPRRPGGRSARVGAQVFEAVIDELVDHGYAGLRYDSVAARAGVHKTTLYRRWPTKGALVSDALAPAAEADRHSVDTGSLEGDLGALYRAQVESATTARARAVTAIFETAAGRDPELVAIRTEIWDRRVAAVAAVLDRALQRGELRRRVEPRTVSDLLYGAVFVRTVIRGERLTRRPPPDLLAVVLDGLRAGPAA